MLVHLRYARYVLRHKWHVFVACCRQGYPLAGLLHDWSKFLPSEWIPYARYFYGAGPRARGDVKPADTGDPAFDLAWLHHQKRNPHHWQYWVLPCDDGTTKVLPMPLRYRCEMLADWRAAGLAQGFGPDPGPWYLRNRHRLQLHPDTRAWVEQQLRVPREGVTIPEGWHPA